MADYSQSKTGPGALVPDNAVQAEWNELEPLITPELLKSRFLFGINLASSTPDHTGRVQVISDSILKDTIKRAVGIAQKLAKIDIFPVRRKEKHPFDQAEYRSYGFFRLDRRPCQSVEAVSVVPADGRTIYTVPQDWIETANLSKGQINIIPFAGGSAFTGQMFAMDGAPGAIFLTFLAGQTHWMPAFWQVEYTSGFPDGELSTDVNELVGVIAAQEILSQLAATNAKATSQSLSIDGLGQSTGGPGGQMFGQRMQELEEKKKQLVKGIKNEYGLGFIMGTI